MHSTGDMGSSSVPAFLTKLWTLVEDPSNNDLICWSPNGNSFHVFDQGRFSKEILPYYFKHNNIASFIRQLNMYGFRKVVNVDSGGLKTEKDDMEFHHPYFQQGQEHLLDMIKRKAPTTKAEEVKVKPNDVNKVLGEVKNLKGKQENMNSKLETIKRENEALWREVASLRQKHYKQQQIVNRLIQFLISMVGGTRGLSGLKRKMPLMLQDSSQLAAAKAPRLTRQLSPEKTEQEYTVISPGASGTADEVHPASGPMIHDITGDQHDPVSQGDNLMLFPLQPSRASTTETPQYQQQQTLARNVQVSDNPAAIVVMPTHTATQQLPHTLTQASPDPLEQLTMQIGDDLNNEAQNLLTSATEDKEEGAIANFDPSSAVAISDGGKFGNNATVSDKIELMDHLDTMQTDLDSLKDLLSTGNYSLDNSTLLEAFSMDDDRNYTLPSTSDVNQPGIIVGNELIQYNPQDFLDLADVSTNLLNEGDNDDDLQDGPLELNTPVTSPPSISFQSANGRRKGRPIRVTSCEEEVD